MLGIPSASIWYGTASSRVDLNPAGASRSYAYAASGALQVGEAYVGGIGRASLWFGTAASWFDLHALLPVTFEQSCATGVFTDGISISVVGYGLRSATRTFDAILWTLANCRADFDGSGFVDTDDFDAFVHAFEAGTDDADFDQSGFVDLDDFVDFVHAFEAGC